MEKQEYKIIADGASDLDSVFIQENEVDIVPFYVSFDGQTYQKEIAEVSVRDFYQKMVDMPCVFPKSSMPSVQDYIDVFEPYAKAGIPIICICITAKFSGSYQCAVTAVSQIKDTYPKAEITVIDSTLNTVLEGMYVREAVRMRKDGYSYEENIASLMKLRKTGRILFTVGGMSYLVHGGRVGKLMGLAANTLNIRPLITMKEGEIYPSGLARSRKKSKDKVIEMICEYFKQNGEDAGQYEINVGYGYDKEEAAAFCEQVRKAVSECMKSTDAQAHMPIEMYQIGATVGVHTGPYPIGVGILKKYEWV